MSKLKMGEGSRGKCTQKLGLGCRWVTQNMGEYTCVIKGRSLFSSTLQSVFGTFPKVSVIHNPKIHRK